MEFSYHRPASTDEAKEKFSGGEDAQYLAGGQTMIPVMKQGLAMPSDVIDLNGIAALREITASGDTLSVGAMARHAEVAASAEVQKAIPALAALALGIADPHVRNRGTLGGSIANNDPAADYPAGLLGLGATVVTDRREISADDFFTDVFETALEDGELILRVDFPVPARANYQKFRHPASRYAIVGVFAAQGPAGTRVAVTGAGQAGVFRVAEMEAALEKAWAPESLDGIAVPADQLNGDLHAAADYRAHLIGVLAKRAVAAAK